MEGADTVNSFVIWPESHFGGCVGGFTITAM